jgi:ABC-type lipoprotein release transport system permease subunit
LNETIRQVEAIVDTQMLNVYAWHFTMERLLQQSESNRAFIILIMGILYVIVGFGIFGTVVMMANERKREFAIIISLGMSRTRLISAVSVELLIKSLIGTIAAVAIALPVTYWFNVNPIPLTGEIAATYMEFGMEPYVVMAVNPFIFINNVITILVISLFTMIYPIQKILKLKLSNIKV